MYIYLYKKGIYEYISIQTGGLREGGLAAVCVLLWVFVVVVLFSLCVVYRFKKVTHRLTLYPMPMPDTHATDTRKACACMCVCEWVGGLRVHVHYKIR